MEPRAVVVVSKRGTTMAGGRVGTSKDLIYYLLHLSFRPPREEVGWCGMSLCASPLFVPQNNSRQRNGRETLGKIMRFSMQKSAPFQVVSAKPMGKHGKWHGMTGVGLACVALSLRNTKHRG